MRLEGASLGRLNDEMRKSFIKDNFVKFELCDLGSSSPSEKRDEWCPETVVSNQVVAWDQRVVVILATAK